MWGVGPSDMRNTEFIVEQWKQFEPEPDFFCDNKLPALVTNVHVTHGEQHAGKESYAEPSADTDIHTQYFRGYRLQAGLVGIGIHNKYQGHCDKGEQRDKTADGEKNDFPGF